MIITLTTDFGTRDGYVGAMKGRILEMCPAAVIVDISHDLGPQDIRGGSMCILRASRTFPSGAIHVVVVDPGVGSSRPALLVEADGQRLIAPDNGVLGPVIDNADAPRVHRLHRNTAWWKPHPSFDGLAVFAPAAACVANGIDLAQLAEPTRKWTTLAVPGAGEIIQFDHFGNAITNIPADSGHSAAQCGGCEFPIRSHYGGVPAGEPVAIINSDGLLELAVRDGSAREQLGLSVGDPVRSA